MASPIPDITLYFLQSSRSIRIAWLLELLSLPYTTVFFPRVCNKAPPDFKAQSGSPLGKAPCLKDGNLTITESGAITEYLCERYDSDQRLTAGGGDDVCQRNKIRTFIHAAEGTFMVYALAITYARWFAPEAVRASVETMREFERGLAVDVGRDLDWLEGELEEREGGFLVGGRVTAADTMCLFSVQFIFARGLVGGREVGEWPWVEGWVRRCEGMESWRRAVERTGHEM